MTNSLLESAIRQLRAAKANSLLADVGEDHSVVAHAAAGMLLSLFKDKIA